MRGRTFAQEHIHTLGYLLFRLFGCGALVVGHRARDNVGVELPACHTRRVPVGRFARRRCCHHFCEHFALARRNCGVVHHFAQAEESFLTYRLCRFGRAEDGSARFKRGCGHAGRKHQLYFERGARRRAAYVARACKAAYVDYFVRVGNDERGSAGNRDGGELFGRELGALYMHMPVDEPGRYYFSAEVVFDFAFVLAHSRYLPAANCNVAAAHAYRKYVEVGGVLQHDVGLPPSSRNVCKAHGKIKLFFRKRHNF